MTVLVFGNPDLPSDSLPVRILPELQRRLPDVEFLHLDPNEEWELPEEITVIDTVVGVKEPRVFPGLDDFSPAPNLSMHDFDAYANLRLLMKLGRLKSVRVVGLPPSMDETAAADWAAENLPK